MIRVLRYSGLSEETDIHVRMSRTDSSGSTITLSAHVSHATRRTDLLLSYPPHVKPNIVALHVAREAILGLLSNRELMSVQLTHAHGGMSDEDFDASVDAHLDAAPHFNEERVATMAAYLAGLVPEKFDADLVSVAARCTLEEASQAIRTATERLDSILPAERSATVPHILSK